MEAHNDDCDDIQCGGRKVEQDEGKRKRNRRKRVFVSRRIA